MSPNLQKPIQVRFFHVVGGGCFGTQYVRWLLRARSLGWLRFEKIIAIDKDPNCQLNREGLVGKGVTCIQKNWIGYFSTYLTENYLNKEARQDHWVPSPLSPHILFLGFLQAARDLQQRDPFELVDFREKVPTPFRMPLKVGTLAVSFAEWKCPVNCIEPPNCPAIHQERTWDMKVALEKYFIASQKTGSAHVLQCRHLIHGVGTIPLSVVFSEFQKLLEDLKKPETKKVQVATVSGCHGLIGEAQVKRGPQFLKAQAEGQNTQ